MRTDVTAVSGGNATLHPEDFGLGAFLSTPDRIVIPRRARGRLSPAAEHAYQQQLVSFAAAIKAISQRLDFKVSSRGWSDLNLRGDMMTRFKEHEAAGRRPVLLYCGDHDPAGLRISDSLRSNMEELSTAVGWKPDNLIIDRFGLNADFIEANGLTWIDNLLTGSGKDLASPKHPDHHQPYVKTYLERFGARKVEANALVVAATAGRELCRSALLKYVETDPILKWRSRLDSARVELRQHFVESVKAQATAWEARP